MSELADDGDFDVLLLLTEVATINRRECLSGNA